MKITAQKNGKKTEILVEGTAEEIKKFSDLMENPSTRVIFSSKNVKQSKIHSLDL